MKRRSAGYSLLEVIVAMGVFLVFVTVVGTLTLEMRRVEKKWPVNFMVHPQVSAVMSRIRKDVVDATRPYYPDQYASHVQSPTTLILYSLRPSGFAETVVYDFNTPGEVRRRAFSVGNMTSDWVARGTPRFRVADFPVSGHPTSVRIVAVDNNGRIAIDQIFQPRAHDQ